MQNSMEVMSFHTVFAFRLHLTQNHDISRKIIRRVISKSYSTNIVVRKVEIVSMDLTLLTCNVLH